MPRISKMRACRVCGTVVTSKDEVCPICRKNDHMSANFSGLIVIFDHEKSEIAKKMNIKQDGLYAIRVR
ncbi:MAG: transcription elongation factor subunit Spt4 [Candidatus Thorarchaeota archaeon]